MKDQMLFQKFIFEQMTVVLQSFESNVIPSGIGLALTKIAYSLNQRINLCQEKIIRNLLNYSYYSTSNEINFLSPFCITCVFNIVRFTNIPIILRGIITIMVTI